MTLAEFLSSEPGMLLSGLALGAVAGSFLNVCAHRIPLGQSIVTPRSRCPQCKSPIPWFRNLPVFSWLVQGGKAGCCTFRIPLRYWLVEVFVAMVFGFLFHRYSQMPNLGPFVAGCIFAWLMIAVVVVDLEHMIIPDRFSMGGAVGGVLLSMVFPSIHLIRHSTEFLDRLGGGLNSLIGLLVGSASLYWIGILAEKGLRKEALGEGDVKLMGCIGAFCGWKGAMFAIFGGATLGALVLLPLMVVGRLRANGKDDAEGLAWGQEVPFGPYLALAGLLYLTCIRSWVDSWFDSLILVFRGSSLG
jgi:leader peptidase (prepilin peptidase) / N-methyltransferase